MCVESLNFESIFLEFHFTFMYSRDVTLSKFRYIQAKTERREVQTQNKKFKFVIKSEYSKSYRTIPGLSTYSLEKR